MGAKAIKLGLLDKRPAYCLDLNVNVAYVQWNRCDGVFKARSMNENEGCCRHYRV